MVYPVRARLRQRGQRRRFLVQATHVERLNEAEQAVPRADATDPARGWATSTGLDSKSSMTSSARPWYARCCASTAALWPAYRTRRLQLDGISELGLGAFSIASPVGGQGRGIGGRCSATAGRLVRQCPDLRTERLHMAAGRRASRALADPVQEHHEPRAEVT